MFENICCLGVYDAADDLFRSVYFLCQLSNHYIGVVIFGNGAYNVTAFYPCFFKGVTVYCNSPQHAAAIIGRKGLFCLGFFGSHFLASIFSREAAVIEQAALYLKGFAPDCILTCMLFAFTGFYNGHGRTTWVMLQGILSATFIRIPAAWLFSVLEGTTWNPSFS